MDSGIKPWPVQTRHHSPIIRPLVFATCSPHIIKASQEHNNTISLIAIPQDMSRIIWSNFVDINSEIKNNIKNILALSATCTYFNNKFEEFGNMLGGHDTKAKNALFEQLLGKINDITYHQTRRFALLLVYAG